MKAWRFTQVPGGAPAVPTISAIDQVDPAGGDVALITVDDSDGITAGTLDGAGQPVFIVDATTVAMIVPPKAAGTYPVTLTNASGTSAPANITYWTNNDANTTLRLQRGNYVGDTWSDDSGNGRHFSETTQFAPEEVREPQFGSASTNFLTGPAISNFLGTTTVAGDTYSISIMFRVRRLLAPNASWYASSALFSDNNGNFNLVVTDSYIRIRHYDAGEQYHEIATPSSLYEWHVLDVEVDDGLARMRIDGGPWTTPSSIGGPDSLAGLVRIGIVTAGDQLHGDIRGVVVSNVARGDAWFDDNLEWWRVKHGFRRAAGVPEIDSYDDVHDPAGGTRIHVRGRNLLNASDARIGNTATPNVVEAMPAIPRFDGVNDKLALAAGASTYFTSNAGTISFLVNIGAATIDNEGNPSEMAAIVGMNALPYLTISAGPNHVRAQFADGVSYKNVAVAVTHHRWVNVDFRWTNALMEMRVNGGDWVETILAGGLADLTQAMRFGVNYDGTKFFNGHIAEVLFKNTTMSAVDLDSVRAGRAYDFGFDLGIAPTSFDRATLSPTGLWKGGDYASGTWTATVGGDATEVTNPPAVYSHAAKRFGTFASMPDADGIDDRLVNATALNNIISANSYSGWALVHPDVLTLTPATDQLLYQSHVVIGDDPSQFWFVFVDAQGNAGVAHYTTGATYVNARAKGVVAKTWSLIQWNYDGSTLKLRVNGGPWTETTSVDNVNAGFSADTLKLFSNYDGSFFYDGTAGEVGISNASMSDATHDAVLSSFNYDHGFSFGGFAPISFDRASLSLSIFAKPGDYALGTWTATASAGASGGRNLTQATGANQPRVSSGEHLVATVPAKAATNGTIDAHPKFDGVDDKLVAAGTANTYFNTTAYSGYIACIPHTIIGNGDPSIDNGFLNDVLLSTAVNAWFTLTLRKNGTASIRISDGAVKNLVVSGVNIGEVNLLQWRYDGTSLFLRCNGGPWASVLVGAIGDMTQALQFGAAPFSTNEFNGRIIEAGLSDVDLGTTAMDNIARGVGADYGTMFGPYAPVAFDRSTLSLTAFWKPGEYTSGLFNGTASAGTSAANDATEVTNPPAVVTRAIAAKYPLTLINASGVAANTNGIESANPKAIPDNVWWLRAGDGVTVDGSNNVTSWADQSGLGDANRNAAPPSFDLAPRNDSDPEFGGRATIGSFVTATATNTRLTTGTWTDSYDSPFSLGVIGQAKPGSAVGYFVFGSNADYHSLTYNSGSLFMYNADASEFHSALASVANPRSFIVGMFDGTGSKLYLERDTGSGPGSIATAAVLGDAPVHVGSYAGATSNVHAVDKLAEVYAYSRALTLAEIRTLRHYRDSYYGKVA